MTNKQVQCLLAFLGYYTIEIDGIAGPKMKEAVRNFQKDHNVSPVDGIAGPVMKKALQKAIGDGELGVKEQAPTSAPAPTPAPVTPVTPVSPDNLSEEAFWKTVKHFKQKEFACKCGCGANKMNHDLIRLLDKIREHFGRPVIINSGIRCKTHNARVGGVSNSQHLYGTAADIAIPGVAPRMVAQYVETLMPNSGGIGIYSWGVHVDVRKTKSRWNG